MDLTAKHALLIAYDVRDSGRLQRTRKVLKGFGEPLQYSVFYCELTLRELVSLRGKIKQEINESEDSVLIATLGVASPASTIEFIGPGLRPARLERSSVVV